MLENFEAEFSPGQLLAGSLSSRLLAVIESMAEGPVWLVAPGGGVVQASANAGDVPVAPRAMVKIDFEPLFWLHAAMATDKLQGIADMVSLIMQSQARYLMAAALHADVSIADHQALQQKHRELMISEARYRELAEQLERRVSEQVETIGVAQRQLYQNEKLSSVGRLAAGVAHEINNPLAFVSSNIQSANRAVGKLQQFRNRLFAGEDDARSQWQDAKLDRTLSNLGEMMVESEQGCSRIARIVKNLKAFSNVDNDVWLQVNLADVLEQVCEMVVCELAPDIHLERQFGERIDLCCKPAHVSQAVYAIINNSQYALRDLARKKIIVVQAQAANDECRIRVKDNGVGMAADVLQRAFDPFFTTKPPGSGVGLGLTVCRDTVKAHGGDIVIQSELDRSTCVELIFPLRQTRGGA